MAAGTPERVAIFIDGGNFYRALKHAGHQGRFDYSALVEFLARGRAVVAKTYFVGIVRNHDHTERSQKMVESQQKFLAGLESEGFVIERGRIVYDHKIREKGVDVKLAVDLVVGAIDDIYDTAIIVSSDTDLLPAIRYVRSRGKYTEYVGFSENPSLGMARENTRSVLILAEDLVKLKGTPETPPLAA